MKQKIFRSTILVAIAVLCASFLIIMSCLYTYFEGIEKAQLRDELNLAAAGTQSSGLDYLNNLESSAYRLTWISQTGEVLFDSKADEETMENHGSRREIRDAFQKGEGSDSRYSSTIMEKTHYFARKLEDGTVLRISVSRASAGLLLIGMVQPVGIVLILAAILSVILSGQAAKRITKPLNELNLDSPLDNDAYEELTPLLQRIHSQHQKIDTYLRELDRRKREFDQVTGNMKEGLVLLSSKGTVLSINPAAQAVFGTDQNSEGKDFLTVERSVEVSQALEKCGQEGHSEIRRQRPEGEFQFDFSRIDCEGKTVGTVLLVFDVTQRAQLERTRREFTANVSHELKTPLQLIMGSAELIEAGMVSQEELPGFVGKIRSESARLVTLIDDIIHLSQMDDETGIPMEPVDLLDIANQAVEAVRDSADAKNVEIRLTGEPAVIEGNSGLLFELAYNLCDNAVKYNREGGKVFVSVSRSGDSAVIQVKDTGIGIPGEHLPRIFERFYRVDKSHSKQSGGTGLGLSIVKHAAACHQGKVDIKSRPQQGTEITVTFPAGS